MRGNIGRRTFLGVLAGGAVAVAAGGAAALLRASDGATDDEAAASEPESPAVPVSVDPRAGITTLFADPAPAARVGAAYRKQQPAAPTLDVFDGAPGADRDALAAHLSRQARADFETGTTTIVAGWVLPRSIAELTATAAQEFPS